MPNIHDSLVTGTNVSVGVAATLLIAAGNRKAVIIRNIGTGGGSTVYVGGSGVTTGTGMPLNNGTGSSKMGDVLTIEGSAAIYGIVAAGTQAVRVLELHD